MTTKRLITYRGVALVIALTIAVGVLAAQDAARSKEQSDDAAAVKEFKAHIAEYLNLRKAIEKKLPAMKNKEELPEMIAAHQQALARKIREARPDAKRGDIFTPATREAFRHLIRESFQDPQSNTKRAMAQQRATVKEVPLRVNGNYPDALAETTFPPALLLKLPALSDELAYRIVGRELVLVDRKANLVIDLLHEALP